MLKLTRAQRKQFGLTGRPLTKLPKVGDRLQFFVKRDSGEIIRRTVKVIPLPEGFIGSSDKVYCEFDDGLPSNGSWFMWDFSVKYPLYAHQTRYYKIEGGK